MRRALALALAAASAAALVTTDGSRLRVPPPAARTPPSAPAAPSPRPRVVPPVARIPVPAPTPTPSPSPRLDARRLRRTVAGYLASRPGRAGVMVRDLRTGLSFGYHADDRFVAASVMKVNVLAGLLLLRREELSASERSLAGRMIRYSDNSAADALYAAVGYGPGLSRLNRSFKLADTEPYPSRWGASGTTPADQVRLLRAIAEDGGPLPGDDRRYILGLMAAVAPEQRWGASAAAARGERVALKNGWTPLQHQGTGWAINTVGRVTGPDHDFLIAVMSIDQPSMETGIATVEHLARTVTDALRAPAER